MTITAHSPKKNVVIIQIDTKEIIATTEGTVEILKQLTSELVHVSDSSLETIEKRRLKRAEGECPITITGIRKLFAEKIIFFDFHESGCWWYYSIKPDLCEPIIDELKNAIRQSL